MSQLHKSKIGKMLFGVCMGLSDSLAVDVAIIRLVFIVGAIFSGSLLFWIYLLLAILLPAED